MNAYTFGKEGLTKVTIIGLIFIGMILGNCGLINLAYAGDPTSFGNKQYNIPEGGGARWTKPADYKGGEPQRRTLDIAIWTEDQIKYFENMAMTARGTEPKIAINFLFNIVLSNPKVGAKALGAEAIDSLMNIAKTSSNPQTRKDAYACLRATLDFSQVNDGLKRQVIHSLAMTAKDGTLSDETRRDASNTIKAVLGDSDISKDLKDYLNDQLK